MFNNDGIRWQIIVRVLGCYQFQKQVLCPPSVAVFLDIFIWFRLRTEVTGADILMNGIKKSLTRFHWCPGSDAILSVVFLF